MAASNDSMSFPGVAPVREDQFQSFPIQRKRETKASTYSQNQYDKNKGNKKEMTNSGQKVRPGSYQTLGLSRPICSALQAAGYNFPTPIQRKVIPCLLSGDDVVAMARTGSGKTAAFLAPLLNRLSEVTPLLSTSTRRNGPRAIVIAPTRELVLQTFKFCRLYSKMLEPNLRTAVVVGGTPLEAQFEALSVCPDIIFATPGRLLQIVAEMGAKGGLTLATVETIIFDEADRLFEGTLAVETAQLISSLKDKQTEALGDRQTVLVSATMPHALAEFSKTGLRKNISVIRLDADKGISPTLAVSFLSSRGDVEKDAALQVLMRRIVEEDKTLVIFAATHRRVEYLTDLLRKCVTKSVGAIHGNMDQTARVDTVTRFKKKTFKALVVTDVAARGIDLPELDAVINYDVPCNPKLFVHRVGRVGRAGRPGLAFSLVTPEEFPFILDILLFVGRKVAFSETSGNPSNLNPFKCHAFAIESSFIIGRLPQTMTDEEVEFTKNAIQSVEIKKAHSSATNAHNLYTKTRGVASGESVRRAKQLLKNDQGGRRVFCCHPWFTGTEDEFESQATEEANKLSSWRPKESVVMAPRVLPKESRLPDSTPQHMNDDDSEDDITNTKKRKRNAAMNMSSSLQTGEEGIGKMTKISAREIALEEEKRMFFLPTRQNSTHSQYQKGLEMRRGKNKEKTNAYRELRDATMDMNADANADLLRSKHVGGNTSKYWDRVSKKFVKGGVTDATSKRNVHVATREAKARARMGESYGTEDGQLFSKWLSKNRHAVEQVAEQVESGNSLRSSFKSGLGNNDFRKGAFGRKARIAEAARRKAEGHEVSNNKTPSELKTVAEIKKSRKLKAKAEYKRKPRSQRNGLHKAQDAAPGNKRTSGKVRVVVRRK